MGRRLFDEVTTPDEAQGWVVSASQIKRWKECPRAWGFEYLKGLRPPPSKAAALGSAVHRLLELHFKGEPWPEDADAKVAKLAQAVIDSGTLPSPGVFVDPENVERPFMLRTGPIQIRGFIDLIVPRARPPMVADHKTSSDPAKYGLTPETLGDDIQATIYAAAVLDLLGVDEVACQWTYCKTRGRAEVHPVRATLDRERTRKNLEAYVLPPTREILDTVARHEADEVDPIELRPVPESCGNWGGCPHSDYCPRSRDQLLTASGWNTETENTEQKENENMSLIEMLKAKKAAQAATAPGGIVNIQVYGGNLLPGCTVELDGTPLTYGEVVAYDIYGSETTDFSGATTLLLDGEGRIVTTIKNVEIPVALIAGGGWFDLTVTNPAPCGLEDTLPEALGHFPDRKPVIDYIAPNHALAELTDAVLSRQQDVLKIRTVVDQIKGLIVDLYR